jgi:pimeloyl-ACP methyl ester carboxylesterase
VAEVPLVLIPALGSDERLWQPVVDRIQDVVDCVVIRGEGDSMQSMADHVLARAPEEFRLAGISMGSYVALEIALRGTGRVRGVALLNGSAIAAPADRRQNSLALIEMAGNGQFEVAVRRISTAVAPTRPDVTALAAAMARDLGPDVFRDQQLAVLERHDRRAELSAIEVPAVVVVGDEDAITPRELGEELAAGLPDAELVVLDGVGHLSTVEDPGRVAGALRSWLARADA